LGLDVTGAIGHAVWNRKRCLDMGRTFKYLRPATCEEACTLKARAPKSSRFLAGGTDLLLQWRDRRVDFEYCVDLSFVRELEYVETRGAETRIGALTRIAAVERSDDLEDGLHVLKEAAEQTASPQVRNIATIGGNLCNAAPSADMAVPLLALGAEACLRSLSGERRVPLDRFFLGVNRTALEEDELLAEIIVPSPKARSSAAFLKVGRNAVDIAIVNVAVALEVDEEGACSSARIVLGAVAPVPMRAAKAESSIVGRGVSEFDGNLTEEVAAEAARETKPITDVRASAEYRRELSRVLVKRAIEAAIRGLGGRVG